MQLPYILPNDQTYRFPNVELAYSEPNGLLAYGGDLSAKRLISAYQSGIFPWFSDDQPILWWSPDPRLVLFPEELHISRSLNKVIKKTNLTFSYDKAFPHVIEACSQPREKQQETWITLDMKQAYYELHRLGIAHSFEVWDNENLVGGLYGVAIGQVFYGESMFSRQTNASKIAFVKAVALLSKWNYKLVDCQVETEYLQSFGAQNIPRKEFTNLLSQLTIKTASTDAWK